MNTQPLWTPGAERIKQSRIKSFMNHAVPHIDDFATLHAYSLSEPEAFWRAAWDFLGVIGEQGQTVLTGDGSAKGSQWFPDAKLNYAENLLAYGLEHPEHPALFYRVEDSAISTTTWQTLREQVSQLQQFLQEIGIKEGDVVAGYLPNLPHTVIAMLATTSLGAIWTSTSPDFGIEGVTDRFGQTKPKVFISVNGYRYNGKNHDCHEKSRAITDIVDSISHWIEIDNTGRQHHSARALDWEETLSRYTPKALHFERVPFSAPLFILYSSGTTGKPKCIIHGVGPILLNSMKEHQLHCDIHPGERVFYFTTCGWMMWNWLVGALASGATLCLYEGSPFYPDGNILWDYAETCRVSLFGTAAKYLASMEERGMNIHATHQLPHLKTLCSTGSVLAPSQFDYVYQYIKPDLHLMSIAGGTDICGCFAIGNPLMPVYRGEIQSTGLGMDVAVFDQHGQPLTGRQGELVCRNGFLNRPIGFADDTNGERYHQAYWARYNDVWHHGDFVSQSERGGLIFYGRSDAILNPGGVRIGTAEIYNQVNNMEEISDSVVIGQNWQNDCRVILFVQLTDGYELNDELITRIKTRIKERCTPRHVPAKILSVNDIPRTKSGKIVELAVRNTVEGRPVDNLNALANPEALSQYTNRPELEY